MTPSRTDVFAHRPAGSFGGEAFARTFRRCPIFPLSSSRTGERRR
jgi:hypothetical protein